MTRFPAAAMEITEAVFSNLAPTGAEIVIIRI